MVLVSIRSAPIRLKFFLNFSRGHTVQLMQPRLLASNIPVNLICPKAELLVSKLMAPNPVSIILEIRFFTKARYFLKVHSVNITSLGNSYFTLLTLVKFYFLNKFYNPTYS